MNLFDETKIIQNHIDFINNNDEHITSVEINQHTLDYLKSKSINGFSDAFNKDIQIIVNEFMQDGEIKFNREKKTIR